MRLGAALVLLCSLYAIYSVPLHLVWRALGAMLLAFAAIVLVAGAGAAVLVARRRAASRRTGPGTGGPGRPGPPDTA